MSVASNETFYLPDFVEIELLVYAGLFLSIYCVARKIVRKT